MTPARPSGVPANATFNAAENEWEVGERRGTVQVGPWVWWRPDGSLVCKSSFDAEGKLHGACRRFHSDGSVSMESRYAHGVRWGKTWHTRSVGRNSPEDIHMAQLPPEASRLEMVYMNGQMVPMMMALLKPAALAEPPSLRVGQLVDMKRDLPKYFPGTPFVVIGGVTDIAHRKHDARVLFFAGPAMADYSILRFAFAPPGAPRRTDIPEWQDPNFGTAIALEEAQLKLFVAVDAMDALIVDDKPPVKWGLRVDCDDGALRFREGEAGSLAENSDLKRGDVFVEVNGRRIDSPVSYVAAICEANRTREAVFRVRRGSDEHTVTLRE